MSNPTVYFKPVKNNSIEEVSLSAQELLTRLVDGSHIQLKKNLPLKVHTGEPGNITFIRPPYLNGIIDFLEERACEPYFVETNTVTGHRSNEAIHRPVAIKHGFTRIPLVIADGKKGEDDVSVPVKGGKHVSRALIASQLANQDQVIVISHFKGHVASGFGGAVKMLGIGFASRNGKMDVHTKNYTPAQKTIDWNVTDNLYWADEFSERVAEYALAAVENKNNIYINFMINITKDCDCDGSPMQPIYHDVGIFASTDPVAIDKACYDQLEKREGKKPFTGEPIFNYAASLGLGSEKYTLVRC